VTNTDQLVQRVRAADPVDPADVEAWWDSPAPRAIVDRVCSDGGSADHQPTVIPPGRRRTVWLVAVVLVGSAGTAGVAAAAGLLGEPAPDPIKVHLAKLDRGIPADLRYQADLDHARAVAATASATLYLADLADGGYCIEVASKASRPRGASCVHTTGLGGLPLDVVAPIPDSDTAPLIVGGRANAEHISAVEARYADGVTTPVSFGLDRAWLLEVPGAEQQSALANGLVVTGLDSSGATVATVPVPALHDDDPLGTAHDADQPLVLTTISDSDDLTRVNAIEGQVHLAGPVDLQVRFPDGSHLAVPVAADGTFRLRLPTDRQGEFAAAAGSLVALRDGTIVASRPIYSVAGWRAGRDGT
jgi:hypothetical protein